MVKNEISEKQRKYLKLLPGVDHILEKAKANSLFNDIPKSVVIKSVLLLKVHTSNAKLRGRESSQLKLIK